MRRIGITGGIGSGKSVVSRLLRIMGYSVYDTDSEAKRLMESSLEVVQKLSECFGRDIYHNGRLNRGLLSSRVFGESDKIVLLNSIVHPVGPLRFLSMVRISKRGDMLCGIGYFV